MGYYPADASERNYITYPVGPSAPGVTLTASGSANTKGSYTELASSSSFTCNSILFHIFRTNAAARRYLIDVSTGAAGAEAVILSNLLAEGISALSSHPGQARMAIAIAITSGTRIAARIQSSTGSSTLFAAITLIKGGTLAGLSSITTYGSNTGDSGGTSVDPGGSANTKGSYAQLSSSTSAIVQSLTIGVTLDANATSGAGTGPRDSEWKMDVATGAGGAEVVLIPDLLWNVGEVYPAPGWRYLTLLTYIAASTRVAVRTQSSITDATDRLLDVALYTGANATDSHYPQSSSGLSYASFPTSSSSYAVNVTASASNNAKGSYAEVTSATSFASNYARVQPMRHDGGSDSTINRMYDLATGAAGSEVVLLSNLFTSGYWVTFSPYALMCVIEFFVAIGSSTRVALRSQTGAGSGSLVDRIGLFLASAGATAGATAPVTYGATTASTSPVTVDAGGSANTKGSYAEITSSTSAIAQQIAIMMRAGGGGVMTAAQFAFDLATGAAGAETVLIPDLRYSTGSGSYAIYSGWRHYTFPTYIASSTRIAARCSCDITAAGDRTLGIMLLAAAAGPPAARVSQDAIEILSVGVPTARVSQAAIELLGGSTPAAAAAARVSQAAIELLGGSAPPAAAAARVSQDAIELLGTSAAIAGQVTQEAVEVANAGAALAGTTQAAVEIANAGAAAARVTQEAAELYNARATTTDVTQEAVEILVPAPPELVEETLNPGWLAWIEWPEPVVEAIASGPIPEIVAYSDWDLQDPPAYYKGFKQARVERWGQAARTLSEPRTGDWQGSAFDLRLSDYDRIFRVMLTSDTDRFWTNGNFILRMVTRPVRAALGEPLTVFVGPLRRADPAAPLSIELLLEDAVGHGMLNDEHLIPQRVIDVSEWDDVLGSVNEQVSGHPDPIIYGTHRREGGAFAPIYLGIEDGTDHVWMVAGHYAAVTDVFLDGVSVLGLDGIDWTIPGMSGPAYEDFFGKRYTLIRGKVGTPGALTDPVLYAENAGAGAETFETWLASYPLGGMPPGVDVRWDVNGTTTPHSGDHCLEGVDLRIGELIRGHFGVTGPPGVAVPRGYLLEDYDNLLIWVLNGTAFWPVGVEIQIEWLVGPTPLIVGSTVVLVDGVYGFDETNVTTWQLITIPIADFATSSGDRADYLLIRKEGSDEITVSLDDISLDGGPTADERPADLAAQGSSALTVNVTGWTDTGDDDGALITAIADQYQHFLINYVANPDGYLTGGPLDNPEWDLFDRTVNVVLEASFATAKAQGLARYPPDGYLGAAILGATAGDRLSVRQWIGRWNLSADARFGVTRYGELFIVMTDPTTTDLEAAPVVDDVLDVLEGTFAIEMGWTVQATRVPFYASPNYVTGEWTIYRDAENVDLGADYGRPEGIPGTPREYWFLTDSDQAKNVAEHEVQRIGDPPRVLVFETNLGDLITRELGEYVVVKHYAGLGAVRAETLCQLEEITVGPGTRRLRIRAVDVSALVDATTPAVAAAVPDSVTQPEAIERPPAIVEKPISAASLRKRERLESVLKRKGKR